MQGGHGVIPCVPAEWSLCAAWDPLATLCRQVVVREPEDAAGEEHAHTKHEGDAGQDPPRRGPAATRSKLAQLQRRAGIRLTGLPVEARSSMLVAVSGRLTADLSA